MMVAAGKTMSYTGKPNQINQPNQTNPHQPNQINPHQPNQINPHQPNQTNPN